MASHTPGKPVTFDWSVGRYETTAIQLETASARVVDAARVVPGDAVLDVACGTGNAALEAGRRGAAVVGTDRARRLLGVARERALREGIDARYVTGDALDLPFADERFDVVLSVFGVIFAQPGDRVAAELVRVVRPGGRIVLSAWTPAGPIREVASLVGEALASVVPPSGDYAPPIEWGDRGVLEQIFAPATVVVSTEELAFVASSARAWAAEQFRSHPGWAAARAVLEPAGCWEEIARRAVGVLETANEDPEGFRTTSTYLIAFVRT